MRITALVVSVLCLTTTPGFGASVVYQGNWFNNTFSSTGPATFFIDLGPPTFSISMDLDGLVFGVADPPPLVITGNTPSIGNDFVLNTTDPFFGNVSGTISPSGAIDVVAVPSSPGIEQVSLAGTLTQSQIAMTYDITFAGAGGVANGTINAARAVPEPSAAAYLASIFVVVTGGAMVPPETRVCAMSSR